MRYDHIDRKDLNIAQQAKSFSVSKYLPLKLWQNCVYKERYLAPIMVRRFEAIAEECDKILPRILGHESRYVILK